MVWYNHAGMGHYILLQRIVGVLHRVVGVLHRVVGVPYQYANFAEYAIFAQANLNPESRIN